MFRFGGLVGDKLMADGHVADVLVTVVIVIPRGIIRATCNGPVSVPVKIGPNCESPLVGGSQKKARDRVCYDPESTTEGGSTNEQRLGFRK